MKRRTFLTGLLVLPLAPALAKAVEPTLVKGFDFNSVSLVKDPEPGCEIKKPSKYVHVVGPTAQRASQFVAKQKEAPQNRNIRYITMSLSNPTAYRQLLGFKDVTVIWTSGTTYFGLTPEQSDCRTQILETMRTRRGISESLYISGPDRIVYFPYATRGDAA